MNKIKEEYYRTLHKFGLAIHFIPPNDFYRNLGRKNSKILFKTASTFHQNLLREKNQKKRIQLYNNFYDFLFNFMSKASPETSKFGYISHLKDYTKYFQDKKILDYGCGQGNSTKFLSNYAKEVYGVDCSKKVISIAKSKNSDIENIKHISIDGFKLPFKNNSLDLIYSNDVIEHLHPDDLDNHLRETYRILNKRGKYILWTPTKKNGPHDSTQIWFPKKIGLSSLGSHIKEYDFAELTTILKKSGYNNIIIPDKSKEVLIIAEK